MSRTTAARRIALLSSSSLALAAIVSAASLGAAVMAPTAALAQACTPAPSSGAGTGSVTYNVGTYATGISCTPAGDLNLNVQAVSGSTVSNFGTGGIVAIAPASPSNPDDLVLRLTGAGTPSTYTFNTAFPVLLNAESRAGDVTIEVEVDPTTLGASASTINASNAATTRAIRAVSTAGGNVTVRNLSEVLPNSIGGSGQEALRKGIIQSSGNANAVAIEARSVGGGDVTIDLGYGSAVGRLYGILAQADGDGAVNILGVGQANTSVAGSAGVRVVAGTGPVVVGSPPYRNNLFSSPIFTGRTGVYVAAGGDITFSGVAQGTDYGVDITNVAAGTTTTVNLEGRMSNGFNQTTGGLAAVRAQGAGALVLNFTGAQSNMNFNFSGMTGPVELNVKDRGAWVLTPGVTTTVVGSNYNKITIEQGGLLAAISPSLNYSSLEPATVLNFADPSFVLDNAGTILVGPDDTANGAQAKVHEAELRIVGLSELRHSGIVLLGSVRGSANTYGVRHPYVPLFVGQTDGWHDDILVFQNGKWLGEGGTVMFDVDLNKTQTNCTREAVTHDFQAADCLRFVNATLEGQTYVNVVPLLGGDRGRLTQQIMDEGVLLIEGTGTTALAAENFALDPAMKGYNPAANTLDMGLYQYALLFDGDANQFKLFGTPSGAAYELPMAATAAHNLWRLSTGSWFERQADLRGGFEPGVGGGVWLRALGEKTDRDIVNSTTLGGLPFSVDSTSEGKTYAITGGLDLINASEGDMGYVFGVTAGYGHTDIDYATGNTQAMDAWSGGLYASLVSGPLFVDAVVNANNVIIDTDAPGFGFLPEGTILSSRMISLGGQVEAGWRLLFDGGFFAEPLASASYVRSKMDDLQIEPDDFSRRGLAVSFEDPSSFRAGVGARFGVDSNVAGIRTQVSLLGRTWQDLEGQNTAAIHNLAFPDDPDIRVIDEFSDQFNEVALGASLWAPNGLVSGFLNLGTKFGEDYAAKTGSVGVRVAW